MDKVKMLKKFEELKKAGKTPITLKDLMSEQEFEEFKNRPKEEIQISNRKINSSEKSMVQKFFNKLSKSTKVKGLMTLGEEQFIFTFQNKIHLIKYDTSSECMIIKVGNDDEHEIGYYELQENFF